MTKKKIAAVSFLNARPITHGLEHGLGDDRFELSFELPSRCAELLERGEVDLGLIPSASYAAASGDRNPIHMSSLSAKAFGFSRSIAHGMWSAAAILGLIEGRVSAATTYSVRFGKPILLPATINAYADHTAEGWDLSLKHPKKGYPYLTGTLR